MNRIKVENDKKAFLRFSFSEFIMLFISISGFHVLVYALQNWGILFVITNTFQKCG